MDAAETLFVPAGVRNNSKGDADAAVRTAFEEPAWNNPVVRIVGPDRKDVVLRIGSDWTVAGLVSAMAAALEARERVVPPWLDLLRRESEARRRGVETAVFGMG